MGDKHYPYIAISKDKYPKLSIKRNVKDKKYKYYGPFPDSHDAYNTLNLLNRLYPFRKCNHIPKSACLYYQMGQCLAPCINTLEDDAYDKYVKEIDKFFKGNNKDIINELTQKMYEQSEFLNFEKAQEYKNLIDGINNITSKQVIEFASNVSDYETLAEFKESIKKNLTETRERNAEYDVEEKLIEEISNNTEVNIPEVFIVSQLESELKRIEQNLLYQGVNLETYCKIVNTTAINISIEKN